MTVAPGFRGGIRQITAGDYHTCALLDDSSVKCWGRNDFGQLGQGDTIYRGDGGGEMGDNLAAIDLGPERFAVEITAGTYHTCALLDDSSVKCWGHNSYGELGLGDANHRGDDGSEMGGNLSPIDLGSGRSAVAITAGDFHTCALLDDSSVKCWGYNVHGELGLGDANHRGDDGSEMGGNLPAIDLGSGRSAIEIAAAADHTCTLLDNGSVKCWGLNNQGQLGQGDNITRGANASEMGDNLAAIDLGSGRSAVAITAGQSHTCALLDDSSVKCWGYNSDGQLGQGDADHRGDGVSEMGDNLAAIDLSVGRAVIHTSAGDNHTCAILDDGSIKCWGRNDRGQLGQADADSRGDGANEMGGSLAAVELGTGRSAVAIAGGNRHTCALLDDSSVKCWGYNSTGQLGQGYNTDLGDSAGEMGDNLAAVDLDAGRAVIHAAAGSNHTCAILDNSSVKCWGRNGDGELGQGDANNRGDGAGEMGSSLSAVDLGTGRSAVAIAGGNRHTCALLDDSSVKCWGRGGRLGQGDVNDRGDEAGEMGDSLTAIDLGTGRSAIEIAARSGHSCALLDDSSVKCWGANFDGQLGQGDANDRGDDPGEMGDSLATIDLGTGRSAVSIAVGGNHTCALLDNSSVKCWGYNISGELGQGDQNSRGDAGSEMGDNLPAIDLGTGRSAVAIAAGYSHTCALLDDRSVKCWGFNLSGELGLGDTDDRGNAAGEMGDNLPAIDLGTGRSAVAIAAGDYHTCALLDDRSVKCWGGGGGHLGLGDNDARGDAASEMGDSLGAVDLGTGRAAIGITAGQNHTCALLDDSSVKCWGQNGNGQLGQGDVTTRGDDGGSEMGDALMTIPVH